MTIGRMFYKHNREIMHMKSYTWCHHSCDTMHKTCVASSQTKYQHRKEKKARSPQPSKGATAKCSTTGRGGVTFSRSVTPSK